MMRWALPLLVLAACGQPTAPTREIELNGAVLKCRDLAYRLMLQGWGAAGNRYELGEHEAHATGNGGMVSWTGASIEIGGQARGVEVYCFVDLFERQVLSIEARDAQTSTQILQYGFGPNDGSY